MPIIEGAVMDVISHLPVGIESRGHWRPPEESPTVEVRLGQNVGSHVTSVTLSLAEAAQLRDWLDEAVGSLTRTPNGIYPDGSPV